MSLTFPRARISGTLACVSSGLEAHVELYFPQALDWFFEVTSPIAGGFLEAWPSFRPGDPTLVAVTDVPGSCLPDPDHTPTAPCAPPFNQNSNSSCRLMRTSIPGYNRFPMNDFPRIAVSEPYKAVSLVWNDARNAPLGDILTHYLTTPGSNCRITNQPSNWLATNSIIVPNFGGYTDNFVSASNTLFVSSSDGRVGVPQRYEAHTGVH